MKNSPIRYTKHARERMYQRGFTEKSVEHLLANGELIRSQGIWIIRSPRKQTIAKCGLSLSLDLRDKQAKCPYIALSNDKAIVTIAYRTKRIKRDTKPHQKARRNSRRKI